MTIGCRVGLHTARRKMHDSTGPLAPVSSLEPAKLGIALIDDSPMLAGVPNEMPEPNLAMHLCNPKRVS